MTIGRPSSFTPQLAAEICRRISAGESLRSVCRSEGMPDKATVIRWLQIHTEFRDQYELARADLLEHWAEEILDISDDGTNDYMERTRSDGSKEDVLNAENIQRSRLRVDTRKWLLSKLAPKKYGDSLKVSGEITHTLADMITQSFGRQDGITIEHDELASLPTSSRAN